MDKKKVAAAMPPPRDVMIIPSGKASGNVYGDNRKFGKDQWARRSPSDRMVIELDPSQTLESVMEDAARAARGEPGPDGKIVPRRIILFVGHAGLAEPRHGQTAEKLTSFDTVPEPGAFANHKQKITSDTLQLALDIASGEITVEDEHTPKPKFRPKGGPAAITDPDKTIDLPKVRMLQRIAKILQFHHVAQFILLSCAAGADTTFAPNLSQVLGIRVGMYKKFVVTQPVKNTNLLQIWTSANHDHPEKDGKPLLTLKPDGTPFDAPSLHEIPEPEIFAP